MYISENTINAVQSLVHDAFIMNSRLDRQKTCLNAELTYPNTSALVHKLAHKYALDIGDGVGDLIENYNIPIIYGNIPTQNTSYLSAKDVITELLDYVKDFQMKLDKCTKIAFDNNDIFVYEGLLDIIKIHKKYLEQAILWKDLVDRYGDDITFDAHITQYDVLN